jgi:hypothetical protein
METMQKFVINLIPILENCYGYKNNIYYGNASINVATTFVQKFLVCYKNKHNDAVKIRD